MIEDILNDWEAGKPVKVPYHRGMGHRWARAYYGQQSQIRCALVGHKISGLLLPDGFCECLRCGGRFRFHGNVSLFEFLIIRPLWWLRK